uniref:Reverse transcriptase domain-containing protein n=1 Tax=Cannabis sativa TaxID=3483 RepID=A0A803P795_CANSA
MADNERMDMENESDFITLTSGEDDDGGLLYDTNDRELLDFDDRWCVVGRFLTKRSLDFMAMQHKMASLWRPGRGMFVKELDENLYLFQFYHQIDVDRVVEGSPWTFDRVPLIFSKLKEGENPWAMVLNKLDFWIQLHGLSTGFMSAKVVKDVGNYIGTFVEADKNNFMGIWPMPRRRQHTIGTKWLRQGLMVRGDSSGDGLGGSSTVRETVPGSSNGGDNQGMYQSAPRSGGLDGGIRGVNLGINANNSLVDSLGFPTEYGIKDNNMREDINDDIDGDLLVLESKRKRVAESKSNGPNGVIKKKELFLVLDQKEAFWKQRAKQFWLKEGDQNTKYFHRAASNWRSFNQISKLKDSSGNWKDWENGLADVVVDYFSSLFSASNLGSDMVIQCIQRKVTTQINEELHQPIVAEEVRKAIFSMHPDKSPGPDSMTPAFYQKCWDIIQLDIVDVVQKFFTTGEFDSACGDANVVLIPKKKLPESMVDLRPIALCNVLYKIITKVMANRMKPYMDHIVSESQSAFIPGRLITDNILVSFEVLHYLKRKRKGKDGYMALKLDLSKAYDRIEWSFLDSVLRKIGFSDTWISLVMKCVSSARYNVIRGGRTMGPITPSRGIRQGDPLSPYIFILCAEGLSALIKRYEDMSLIHGCKVANGAPKVSHMLFADDNYLYCKATLQEANQIRELLHQFECASGQKVNLGKSSIFYSTNTVNHVREDINSLLQMPQADERSMYLGLPSTMGRNKSAVLGFLKDRVRKKLQGWDSKVLSCCKDIESTMARFWWKISSKENKGIPWMSWDRMCNSKNNRGLGFRNLHDFNLVLLGKQGNNPSFVWRSVWEAQSLVRAGVRWSVGNGSSINVLNEPWLPDHQQPLVIYSHLALQHAKVCNLMSIDMSTWDDDILKDLFEERDQRLIKQISSSTNQTLWSLKLPPKIKNLMWRAGSNCLPTLSQLASKHVPVNTRCPLCEEMDETITHILLTCRVVKKVWERVGIGTTVTAAGSIFLDWCVNVFTNLTVEKQGLAAALCWAVWGARNDVVWQGKSFNFSAIVASAKSYLDQWKYAQKLKLSHYGLIFRTMMGWSVG